MVQDNYFLNIYKILKKELSDPKKQEEYIKELIKDVKFN